MTHSRSPRPSGLSRVYALLLMTAGLPGASLAQQETPAANPAVVSTPAKTQKIADLTARYRFSERFTTDDEHTGPGVVGSYRMALLEVVKDSLDTAKGAPKRTESSRQAIFTERPGERNSLGAIVSTTRTFESFKARPEESSKTMGPRPLEGLTVLVRPKNGGMPLILSLTEGRTLTEYEYEVISRQVFVPQLATLLPTQALKVGDNWRVPPKAVQSLLGDPWIENDRLVGKLAEIRKEVDGPRMVAAIAISGKVAGPSGDSTVNAEILFTFLPGALPKSSSTRPTFPPRPTGDIIESRGAITELRMTRLASGPLPGPGRLRFQSNRELTMHRQAGLALGVVAPPLLEKTPESTEANSWLSHVDPSGRYAFRHPEDLLPPDRSQLQPDPKTNLLIRSTSEGRDMLQLEFVGKTLTPEDLKKGLAEKCAVFKKEVTKGSEEWLPEADWPRMRVHRIEAAVNLADAKAGAAAGDSTSVHFDGYLVLFGQSASVMAIATTSRESSGSFRLEVEQILKSIQIDPGKPPVQ